MQVIKNPQAMLFITFTTISSVSLSMFCNQKYIIIREKPMIGKRNRHTHRLTEEHFSHLNMQVCPSADE